MIILAFNFYNILITLGVLHGFVFSAILLFSSKFKSKSNIYLSFTILSLCFNNLQYLLYDIKLIGRFYVDYLFVPFEFLILPMFYFFVKSYLNIKINKKQIYLFISPFVITLINQSITNLFEIDYHLKSILNLFLEYFAFSFSFILIVLVFKNILYYEKQTFHNKVKIVKPTIWLKRLLMFGLGLCVLWFSSLSFLKLNLGEGLYSFYPLWIGISILIYWIAYTAVFQTNIYNDRKKVKKQLKKEFLSINKIKTRKDKFNKIHSLILKKQLFLNPNLSLLILSKEIGKSQGYISQLINSSSKKNFNDYINELRVEQVKKLLINKKYSNYTITAIGLESGFNTKASFYAAFKKATGKTPNEFKKTVQNL